MVGLRPSWKAVAGLVGWAGLRLGWTGLGLWVRAGWEAGWAELGGLGWRGLCVAGSVAAAAV